MNLPVPDLKRLIRESEVTRALTIEDVVFKIGPRINAAGRMETGSKAVDLLVSSDSHLATGISKEINNFNIERRSVDRIITTEAMRMISEDQRTVNSRTTVLYNPNWKKGVIGIVASRLLKHITVQLSFLLNQMALQQVLPDLYRVMIFTRLLRHAVIFLRVSADICLLQD